MSVNTISPMISDGESDMESLKKVIDTGLNSIPFVGPLLSGIFNFLWKGPKYVTEKEFEKAMKKMKEDMEKLMDKKIEAAIGQAKAEQLNREITELLKVLHYHGKELNKATENWGSYNGAIPKGYSDRLDKEEQSILATQPEVLKEECRRQHNDFHDRCREAMIKFSNPEYSEFFTTAYVTSFSLYLMCELEYIKNGPTWDVPEKNTKQALDDLSDQLYQFYKNCTQCIKKLEKSKADVRKKIPETIQMISTIGKFRYKFLIKKEFSIKNYQPGEYLKKGILYRFDPSTIIDSKMPIDIATGFSPIKKIVYPIDFYGKTLTYKCEPSKTIRVSFIGGCASVFDAETILRLSLDNNNRITVGGNSKKFTIGFKIPIADFLLEKEEYPVWGDQATEQTFDNRFASIDIDTRMGSKTESPCYITEFTILLE